MPADWENRLENWVSASPIDASTAGRIRTYEAEHAATQGLRWPVLLALVFGGILLTAGILLFVAAHWDTLSPAARFALLVLMLAVLHVGAAFAAPRSEAFATVLHGIGTIALGAGISLAGQIFHLQVHWPSGILL